MWMTIVPEDVELCHCLELLMTLWSRVHLTILDDHMNEEEKRNLNLLFVTGSIIWSFGYNSLTLPLSLEVLIRFCRASQSLVPS